MGRYERTPENTAWEREPWKCPYCGYEGVQVGHWTHEKYCKNRAERFWAKVNKAGPGGCWLWTGYTQRFGHGWLGTKKGLAHRYAWETRERQDPGGEVPAPQVRRARLREP